MTRFDDQTVLVTGGTGGQGASHVRAFHAEGANVVIGDIDAERGAALVDELGTRARFVRLDVTDESSWSAAVLAAESAFGALDVLVNNAGVQNPPATIEDTEQATWSRILAVNLTGAFLGIKAATPALRRAAGGAMVNIASTMGLGGTAHYAPYVASKWALRGLTRTAALELARDRIRVDTIHPGVIATSFIQEPAAGATAAIADFYSPEPFAIPRLGEPTDVSQLLLFLTSSDASFITGSEYVIDGGLLLGPRPPGCNRMSAPHASRSTDPAGDASPAHLPDNIRRAIEITPAAGTRERIIDITTVGRRTGRARRIEIFFYRAADATYLCSGAGGAATDWHANLLANPDFTFHLKNGVRADLAARATPVTDPAERQAVLAEIVADLNQPHDPGTIRPTRLEDWADSRLMRISFRQAPRA